MTSYSRGGPSSIRLAEMRHHGMAWTRMTPSLQRRWSTPATPVCALGIPLPIKTALFVCATGIAGIFGALPFAKLAIGVAGTVGTVRRFPDPLPGGTLHASPGRTRDDVTA